MRVGIGILLISQLLFASEPSTYFPGKYIDWNTYSRLSKEVDKAWRTTGGGGEKELTELNKAIEPEAIQALLLLLKSKDTKFIYGGFTPVQEPEKGSDQFSPSIDGLMGLRLVRQLEEKDGKGSPRLISFISTYYYNPVTFELEHRSGPDVARVRVEITPFIKATEDRPTEGFAGFSLAVEVKDGKIVRVYSESYLDDSMESHGLHGKIKYPNVSFCGMSHHCNVCHHKSVPNFFRPKDFKEPLEENRGVVKFLEFVTALPEMKGKNKEIERLKTQLLNPKTTFDPKPLEKALLARWKEIQK